MKRILASMVLLGLAACNTSQAPELAGNKLSSEELNALLVGNVVVLQRGGRLSYSADGVYEWKNDSQHDRGVYAIKNGQVCVKFDDGNARCDHYRKTNDVYVVVDKNNETGVVASFEKIESASE